MLAFLEMRNGGDRMARGSVGTGRGRTMGPAQAPSPDRRCSSLFANQVGVRLLPARANLRGWARLLTPPKLRTLEPDLERTPRHFASNRQTVLVDCHCAPALARDIGPGRRVGTFDVLDVRITMTSNKTREDALEFEDRYPASENLLGHHDYEQFSKHLMPDLFTGPSQTKDSIHMCGWLDKYYCDDRGTKSWRPRWVYLLEDRLCYGSATSTDNVKPDVKYILLEKLPARQGGRLAVSRLKVAPQGLNGQPGDNCAFHLVCDNRTHTFAGKTPEDALRWTEKLNDLAEKRADITFSS